MPFYEPVVYLLVALFLTLALFDKKVLAAFVALTIAVVMAFNLGLNYQDASLLNIVLVLINQVLYIPFAVYLAYKAGVKKTQSTVESEPLPLDVLQHDE